MKFRYGYLANGMTPSCDAAASGGLNFLSTFYFLVFIVIGALVMLTLFIGVVTTSMDESTQEQAEAAAQDKKVVEIAAQQNIDDSTLQIYKNVFGCVIAVCLHLAVALSRAARTLRSLATTTSAAFSFVFFHLCSRTNSLLYSLFPLNFLLPTTYTT